MGLIRPYLKLRKQLLASLAADMDDSFILHIKNWINCFHDERLQLEYSDLRNRILAETHKILILVSKNFGQ